MQLLELTTLLLGIDRDGVSEKSATRGGNMSIALKYINSLDSVGGEGSAVKEPTKEFSIAEALESSCNTIVALKGTSDPCAVCTDADILPSNRKRKHIFDINSYRQRQLAFQIEYDGANYLGFASQEDGSTVENHIFQAFTKLKLIEDRKTCSYSRCGRTDKGVSALGQIISLRVRSANLKVCKASNSTIPSDTREKDIPQIDYCAMLNRCLPSDIRAIGCTPVTDDFSARFSAAYRTYRYFFLRKSLDIASMQRAADYLVGTHDFRNLCKMDIANVTNFKREIFFAQIVLFCSSNGTSTLSTVNGDQGDDDVFMLEIKGIAFLWHMVRCIMAVLFMVGQRSESPDVMQRLLDIQQCPRKPSYMMAPDLPLVLHECGFDNLTIRPDVGNLWKLTAHYRSLLEKHVLCAAKARNVLDWLQTRPVLVDDATVWKDRVLVQHKLKVKSAATVAEKSADSTILTLSSASEEGSKRKHDQTIAEASNGSSIDLEEKESCLTWRDVLQDMITSHGLWPQEKYVPYVPMMKV